MKSEPTFVARIRQSNRRSLRLQKRRAFTLIETALATVIVGVGVLAIVSAQQAFHIKNSWSSHADVAMRLANEIREMTLNLPRHDPVTGAAFWGPDGAETFLADFDDLDDFDGLIFTADDPANGPINALREIIPNMDGWSQTIRVYNVETTDITSEIADGTSDVMCVEVIVHYQGLFDIAPVEMTKVTWITPN